MQVPFSETDRVDAPVSLYAATKRSCELLASVYHDIYGMSVTGLRFFTVYGPWGRPDMAALVFAHKIAQGLPVKIFKSADGSELARDFTYVDDIVQVRACTACMRAAPRTLMTMCWCVVQARTTGMNHRR
jgi:UDP-glucuronate 4-epimerase